MQKLSNLTDLFWSLSFQVVHTACDTAPSMTLGYDSTDASYCDKKLERRNNATLPKVFTSSTSVSASQYAPVNSSSRSNCASCSSWDRLYSIHQWYSSTPCSDCKHLVKYFWQRCSGDSSSSSSSDKLEFREFVPGVRATLPPAALRLEVAACCCWCHCSRVAAAAAAV